jgi:hypothetical protein
MVAVTRAAVSKLPIFFFTLILPPVFLYFMENSFRRQNVTRPARGPASFARRQRGSVKSFRAGKPPWF